MDLRGRHALVCGGSAGIGRAAAAALARHGARLTLLARREASLQEAVADLAESGAVDPDYRVADLDARPALLGIVEEILSSRGNVDVLINNTGGPPAAALLDAEDVDLSDAFGRHVLASHLLTRSVLPAMVAQQWGRIVNVISTSVREPLPGLGVSNVIRGAMASWAKTLSRELPPGVTVNNVLPGFTDTERLRELGESLAEARGATPDDIRAEWISEVPEGRLGEPAELGDAVAYLVGASYVRGVSLVVDGGRMRSI